MPEAGGGVVGGGVDELLERLPERFFGFGEGFYGKPYDWEDRDHLLGFLADHGLNTYVYAPKNDPYHRDNWRAAYPPEELKAFEAFISRANGLGVKVVYAIGPLGMRFSNEAEHEALRAKLAPFVDMGLAYYAILFDDVPEELPEADRAAFSSLGEAHRVTTERLYEWLRGQGAGLSFCPVEYTGPYMSPYLEEVARLPGEIPFAWTGMTVICPEIRVADVRARSESLGHPLILWDNFPANDFGLSWLHIGPWMGRGAELVDSVAGLFMNGLNQARSNQIALAQLGDLLRDGKSHEPLPSWRRACREVGAGAPGEFEVLAEQVADSVCYGQPAATLAGLLDGAETAAESGDAAAVASARAALRDELARQSSACAKLGSHLEDKRLLDEVRPWIDQMSANVTAMMAAVDGWTTCAPEARGGAFQMHEAMGLMGGNMLRERAARGEKYVHGCRLGLRAVLETVPGGWRILPEAVVENTSQADRLFTFVFREMTRPR